MGNGALQRFSDFWLGGANLRNGIRLVLAGHHLRPGRLSSIVEVRRIKGTIFDSKEAAEKDGFKLCRDWIDNRLDRPPSRRYRSLGGKIVCDRHVVRGP